jgi:spoIIIJ-associated protein
MILEEVLSTFIRCSSLRISYQMVSEGEDWFVSFTGEDASVLLARNGEVLRALEYLANRFQERHQGGKVTIDCEGFRAIRAEELRLMALTAAAKVKQLGRPYHLSPMSPEERRIVHLAVAEDPELRTESEGYGENRKVVIYPKSHAHAD